jgi:DNA-binding NtrC family response regulator
LGFTIRDISLRLGVEAKSNNDVFRSKGQMTELVGRVPLKDIVSETTDLIEQMCIEAALELTGDNRSSAAEMLGLSRQSLYVKLRRFGINVPENDTEA